MFLIILALNAIYGIAFNDFDIMENGNAEERFSFDGYFDRIEHGYKSHGYHEDDHHSGIYETYNGNLHMTYHLYIIRLWAQKPLKR